MGWWAVVSRCLLVSTDVRSPSMWLLFLPLWPVPVKTPVVFLILTAVLLLGSASFVLLGHLLVFHLYLSTYRPGLALASLS